MALQGDAQGISASERGRMGVRRTRRYTDNILVGRSTATRSGLLQGMRYSVRFDATAEGRKLSAKPVRPSRYGGQHRSVGGGLLAQGLPRGTDRRLRMGREKLRLACHTIGILEERYKLRSTCKSR